MVRIRFPPAGSPMQSRQLAASGVSEYTSSDVGGWVTIVPIPASAKTTWLSPLPSTVTVLPAASRSHSSSAGCRAREASQWHLLQNLACRRDAPRMRSRRSSDDDWPRGWGSSYGYTDSGRSRSGQNMGDYRPTRAGAVPGGAAGFVVGWGWRSQSKSLAALCWASLSASQVIPPWPFGRYRGMLSTVASSYLEIRTRIRLVLGGQ
jgi:hypothetical protein